MNCLQKFACHKFQDNAYRSLILEKYCADTFADTFLHTCINCVLYPDTVNKSHWNLTKIPNKLTQTYCERKYYTLNMQKQPYTCKIKEKHNYPPTTNATEGSQTEYLVFYFVHISYGKGYKLFTNYYMIYCTA